jgi:hypothetical protein
MFGALYYQTKRVEKTEARLEAAETARRKDAITFLREQKDIMADAFEMTTKVGNQCEAAAQAVVKLLDYMGEE